MESSRRHLEALLLAENLGYDLEHMQPLIDYALSLVALVMIP
jgi:hypothetical protein